MKFQTIKIAGTALIAIWATTLALSSLAAGNPPPVKCPMGQLPVLEQGSWHCEEAKIKAAGQETQRNQNAGAKRHCPQGQVSKLENGMWKCVALGIAPPDKEGEQSSVQGPYRLEHSAGAAGAGDRPRCPKGQIAKMENGHWMCKAMALNAPATPGSAQVVEKPKCPKNLIPKWENGQWFCRQPGYAVPEKPGQE